MKREKINMNKNKKNFLIAITIISMLLIGTYIPITIADNENYKHKGFDKGPSSLPVVPLKKTTLVNFDENSYLDDYAYLASVPTAVFKEQNQLKYYEADKEKGIS